MAPLEPPYSITRKPTKQDILTIEEEGADPLYIIPTLTCEGEGNGLTLTVRDKFGNRVSIRLTQKQAFNLGYGVKVLADKLPLIRLELIRPIYESLAGIQLNQREADHLIERIKTRVRE